MFLAVLSCGLTQDWRLFETAHSGLKKNDEHSLVLSDSIYPNHPHCARRDAWRPRVAEDIDEKALAKLRERADREHVENVEVVLGTADDPHLTAQLDAALIHNAYHEMSAHETILARIRESLRPGGRLLIVEPVHESSRGLPRAKQEANHDIEIGLVEDDLSAAGFEIQQRDVEFVKFKGVAGGFWLLLARRP